MNQHKKMVFYKKVLWYMISLFLVMLWALDGFWIFSSYLMERVQWFLLAYLTHSLNLFEFTISICKYVLEVKSHKRDNSSSVVDSLILFLKVLSIFQEITVCRYVSPTLVGVSGFCRVLKPYRFSGSGFQISRTLPDFSKFFP